MSACASNEPPRIVTRVEYQRQQVPVALLTCRPSPPVPTPVESQKAVGLYLLDLFEAGEDCRTKLDAVRGLVDHQ